LFTVLRLVVPLLLTATACGVSTASGSEGPRWIPPESRYGTCSVVIQCDGDDAECQRRSADASTLCAIDQARQTHRGKAARWEFDALGTIALDSEFMGYEAKTTLSARISELLPEIVADMRQAERNQQRELAARRAEFVLRVLRTVDDVPLHSLEEVDAVQDRVRDFHRAEAKRLELTFPIVAAFHSCHPLVGACPQGRP
jgi:hypothetical protein